MVSARQQEEQVFSNNDRDPQNTIWKLEMIKVIATKAKEEFQRQKINEFRKRFASDISIN